MSHTVPQALRARGWLWAALTVAVALVGVTFGVRDVRLNSVIHCVVLAVVVVIYAALARRGRVPDGVGFLGLLGLMAWLAGHVMEMIVVFHDPRPKPIDIADGVFAVSLLLLVVMAARLWLRSTSYVDRSGMLRSGLDTLLIATGITLVIWQLTMGRAQDSAAIRWEGVLVAYAYVAFSGALAAVMITWAWQRGDTGSRKLAVAVSIIVIGVITWSLAKFGPDLRYVGVMLMTLGLLGIPAAVADPSHQRPSSIADSAGRDRMGALAFHLVCFGLALVTLPNKWVSPVVIGLGLMSVTLVFLRVWIVRASEQRLVDQLRVLAFTDPLTSVGNRRSLLDRLNTGGPSWLITIDLDGFKQVNDQYGHEAGDDVLRAFVSRMDRIVPDGAHLARIGGDEFAVVFDGNEAAAVRLAEKIVEKARDPHYARLTASVGLTRHQDGTEANHTVRDSDIAMQEAKRAGKDRVAVLTTQMVKSRLRDLEVGARLAETLYDIKVVYQPVVALRDGLPVVAVEALARWHHRDLGDVSPSEFIPIAEQQGLVADLGLVVFSRALQQARDWLDAGLPRQVMVNVSWLQLRNPSSVAALAEHIRANPQLAEWIVLEVTETVFSEDDAAVAAVRMLRELGVVIAVDDFGTGASNLRRLRTLPVDVLKIDKSLLDGAADDRGAAAMLEMVNWLGQSLGMAVVAEGVEDEPTAEMLAQMGVAAAQGYLFARPMVASLLPAPAPLQRPWLCRRFSVASTWPPAC